MVKRFAQWRVFPAGLVKFLCIQDQDVYSCILHCVNSDGRSRTRIRASVARPYIACLTFRARTMSADARLLLSV
jgi:hypothetical protein